jgi:dimethylamine/trimethylamine dehydrogenase
VGILTPDDLLDGVSWGGDVVLFDDEHFYLGGVLAELLAAGGARVVMVTPEPVVSAHTEQTMEQHRVHRRLLDLGVEILPHHVVTGTRAGRVVLEHTVTGSAEEVAAGALLLVTARLPNDALAVDLRARRDEWPAAGLVGARAVGDALAPSAIAGAVWDGRRFAEELDGPDDAALFRRNVPRLDGFEAPGP